jgi:hypothetical protein
MIGGDQREASEGLFHPGPGIHAALLAGGGEARQDRQSTAAVVVAKEEPVLAADSELLHRPFGRAVVDG